MKKVVFFTRSLDAGGAERQLLISARGLAERGYTITVITFYSGGFYEDELSGTEARLHSLNKRGRWDLIGFFCRLVSLLRTEAPDVVYSFLGVANIFSILAQPFIPKTKVVLSVRASNMDLDSYDWATRWSYWVECKLARFADVIVANSYTGLEYAVAHGFPRSKMVVIANGIDTDRFRADRDAGTDFRKLWNVGAKERLVGLVGRIDPMKGHSTFLEAALLIKRQLPNVHFICVGKGEAQYEKAVQEQAKNMGLDDVLSWTGVCSNMVAAYNALDILTSSSSFGEGFPNVVGEAMACGVPCVVTDVGDSALVVGEEGLVVPPDDSEALCSAWREMLSLEATEFLAISTAARERVEKKFNIDAMLDSTEAVLWKDNVKLESNCRDGMAQQ